MITNEPTSGALAERVARLERSNQRLYGVVVLLIAAAALQTFWHFLPTPGIVVAKRFMLRPPSGPVRAELALWDDGTPALRLNNDRGEARAILALRRDGNLGLRLTDDHFNNRLELNVGPDGTPRVGLSGPDGKSRADLWVDAANSGHVTVDRVETRTPAH
jgi:hypothetical protein